MFEYAHVKRTLKNAKSHLVSNLFIECDKCTHTLLKYYDKGMCSNNIQHNMTECTKQQHTTNKEIKKYKIEHNAVSVKNYSLEFII